MSKNIKFNISFINHLDENINLNDFLINVEAGSFLYEINKGYINLDFVTNKVYYDPSIVSDNIERIKVKWQINDNVIQEELFCIEAIDYLKDNNIKVYCKSKSFKYEKYYINKEVTGKNLVELISNIFNDDINLDFTNLTNFDLIGTLHGENKSGFDLLNELMQIYRFEFFYRQGTIYFCDKKNINKNDVAVTKFSGIKDIESFNTSTDLFKKRVNKIVINKDDKFVNKFESALKLEIKPNPQNTSPDEILIYTDDKGNKYKLAPQKAQFYVYYSPKADIIPEINLSYEIKEKTIVEKYELNNERYLKVTAHIKELLGVEGVDSYTYDIGDNLLIFDKEYTGEVKVSYKSDVLAGIIENSKYPKNINFNIKYLDRIINYTHKIQLNYYYPLPYNLTLNTISDWGLSVDASINKTINISKYDTASSAFVAQGSTTSDEFGDFVINLTEYGTYRFDLGTQEPLFLDYFVNKKNIYMNELNC